MDIGVERRQYAALHAETLQATSLLLLFRRVRGGEVAAAGLLCGLELHQFDANEIRIEHVELPLSDFPHLRMLLAVLLPAMRLEDGLRFFHVGYAVGNV